MKKDLHKPILSSKQHLESVFDSITDPILIIGPDLSIHRLNYAASDIMGEPYRALIGRKCYEKFHGRARPCAACPYSKVFRSRKTGRMRLEKAVRGETRIYDARFFPLNDKDGRVTALVEHYVDITEGETAKATLEAWSERVKRELMVARKIQEKLLPGTVPGVPGLALEIFYQPVEDVGGDLYDILGLDDEHFGITIADVSGHGIPAAFISAMAKMSFYHHTAGCRSAKTVFENINFDLYNNLLTEYYVSAFYCIYNPLYNRITFSRAAHPEPLLLNRATGEVTALQADGYFLGMMSNGDFEEKTLFLQKGDRLFLYTDGVTESQNPQKEKFGLPRLKALLRDTAALPLPDVKKRIIAELSRFSRRDGPADDITFILLETTGADCIERFRLGAHFSRNLDIRLARIGHPMDFKSGIQRVLDSLKGAWYPKKALEDLTLALYETLAMVAKAGRGRAQDIYLAWQSTADELRLVITDDRYGTAAKPAELYRKKFSRTLAFVKSKKVRVLFPDSGRKLMLVVEHPKY